VRGLTTHPPAYDSPREHSREPGVCPDGPTARRAADTKGSRLRPGNSSQPLPGVAPDSQIGRKAGRLSPPIETCHSRAGVGADPETDEESEAEL
jgi:hypothetical protein